MCALNLGKIAVKAHTHTHTLSWRWNFVQTLTSVLVKHHLNMTNKVTI